MHLSDVDRLLLERNRALIAARRATSAAEAGVDTAGARPNPILSLGSTGISAAHSVGRSDLDTTLRIDQPFERGNKRGLRVEVANRLLDASRSDESDSLRQQRLLAYQAYFDLKAAEDKARLSEVSAQLARQMLSKAELRHKAGDISPADVARIRTDAERAASDATQADIDRRRVALQLAQLLASETAAASLATADPWPELSALPRVENDPDERPDVAAARRRVEAAEKAVDLAKAQQVRDFTIGAQIERQKSSEYQGNTVGVGISIPLFTGNDFRGEIRRAYVDLDSARDDLERIRATTRAEIGQFVFEAERLSERARRLRDEALPAARKASAAIQLAFTQGAASALDLIDARRSQHAVEIDTANALADAAKARAAWSAAVNRQELQ